MGWFIFMHVSSQCLLSCLEHLDPSEQSDQDDIEDAIDNELLSLSKPWSGEGKGTLVTKVTGPSISCYTLSLKKAVGVFELVIWTIVSGHILRWGSPLGIKLKRLLGWHIHPGTSRSPCIYSIIQYSLGNSPFAILYCHRVSSEIFLPMSQLLWGGMWNP